MKLRYRSIVRIILPREFSLCLYDWTPTRQGERDPANRPERGNSQLISRCESSPFGQTAADRQSDATIPCQNSAGVVGKDEHLTWINTVRIADLAVVRLVDDRISRSVPIGGTADPPQSVAPRHHRFRGL